MTQDIDPRPIANYLIENGQLEYAEHLMILAAAATPAPQSGKTKEEILLEFIGIGPSGRPYLINNGYSYKQQIFLAMDTYLRENLPSEVNAICNVLQNTAQLLMGIKPDAVTENWWSEWDESVLVSVIDLLKKYQPFYNKESAAPQSGMRWVNIVKGDNSTLPKDQEEHLFDSAGFEDGAPMWGRVVYNGKFPSLHTLDSSGEDEYHGIWGFTRWLDEASPQSDAVEFAEWVEDNYAKVFADERKRSAWVHKEHTIMIHGSDHYNTRLVNEHGQKTAELYQIFLSTKTK